MPQTRAQQIQSRVSSLMDALDAESEAKARAEAAAEAAAKVKASEATAALGPLYVGFSVVTPKELELLRWAKMQVQIRQLQFESGRLLMDLTKFVDPGPDALDIKKNL
jgi:hypothetical protein